MADEVVYWQAVTNYTGGTFVNVEIGSRDGRVFIRLGPDGGASSVACLLEPEEAREVAQAIAKAALTRRKSES